MNKNYAIIDEKGLVVNVAVWDGVAKWNPGDQYKLVLAEQAGPGWTYDFDKQVFSPPSQKL